MIAPPAFSSGQGQDDDWDLQRDHVALLNRVLELTTPGGTLFLVTGFRRFKLAEAEIRGATIREISKQTVPPDFRNTRIHRCWRLVLRNAGMNTVGNPCSSCGLPIRAPALPSVLSLFPMQNVARRDKLGIG